MLCQSTIKKVGHKFIYWVKYKKISPRGLKVMGKKVVVHFGLESAMRNVGKETFLERKVARKTHFPTNRGKENVK